MVNFLNRETSEEPTYVSREPPLSLYITKNNTNLYSPQVNDKNGRLDPVFGVYF